MEGPASNVDDVLRAAIEQRRLIQLFSRNKSRILEPHDYGVHIGSVKRPGYQAGGVISFRTGDGWK